MSLRSWDLSARPPDPRLSDFANEILSFYESLVHPSGMMGSMAFHLIEAVLDPEDDCALSIESCFDEW